MGACYSSTPSTLSKLISKTTPEFWAIAQEHAKWRSTPGASLRTEDLKDHTTRRFWISVQQNMPKWESITTAREQIYQVIKTFEEAVMASLHRGRHADTKALTAVPAFLLEFVYLCKLYEFLSAGILTQEAWVNCFKAAWRTPLPTTLKKCRAMLKVAEKGLTL
jgi:hypothetical protein